MDREDTPSLEHQQLNLQVLPLEPDHPDFFDPEANESLIRELDARINALAQSHQEPADQSSQPFGPGQADIFDPEANEPIYMELASHFNERSLNEQEDSDERVTQDIPFHNNSMTSSPTNVSPHENSLDMINTSTPQNQSRLIYLQIEIIDSRNQSNQASSHEESG